MFRGFIVLVCMADIVADVEARVDFFAGIEDVFGVEDVLGVFENIEHFLGEHQVEVGGTDNAVVVFTADITFEFYGCFKKSIGHFFYKNWRGFIGEV